MLRAQLSGQKRHRPSSIERARKGSQVEGQSVQHVHFDPLRRIHADADAVEHGHGVQKGSSVRVDVLLDDGLGRVLGMQPRSVTTLPACSRLDCCWDCSKHPSIPGALYLLSLFYTRREIATRVAILYSANIVATASSGLIAAATFATLDKAHGIQGWKWLFIIEAVVTFGVAVICLYTMPEPPAVDTMAHSPPSASWHRHESTATRWA
ncbi:hypothetical protein L1887_62848 [Cichorium endivia]|nr:hypothetical protein L1887_62848 [Cichorium endivia]